MFFKLGKHEAFVEKSEIHCGLKKQRTGDGWICLVGSFIVTYSYMG